MSHITAPQFKRHPQPGSPHGTRKDTTSQNGVRGGWGGEPLVLVPGGLTGWLSWEPHAKRLSEKYRVTSVRLIAVDLGLLNEPVPANCSVDYETEALTRALEQDGVEQAHFAAWSFGAEVTLNFALNNPGRIKTLTLIEPSAIWVLRSRGPFPKTNSKTKNWNGR